MSKVIETILRAEDFSCPSCVTKIEKQVGAVPGVSNVEVLFASNRVNVSHSPEVSAETLVAAVKKAGFTSTVSDF